MLPETQTTKAISSFLVHFITQSREVSQNNVVQTYGESLVLRILLNLGCLLEITFPCSVNFFFLIAGTAPRASIDLHGDILLALNKKYCDNLSRWLNSLLNQENFPSPKLTAQQKETFIRVVLR